jgi:triosephosphate isomerase
MKYFLTNLKRFDIPVPLGGVNRLAPVSHWGSKIVRDTESFVNALYPQAECVFFLPEAHLLPALAERGENSHISIGAQGVHREDVSIGGNFGGFTTLRTAKAVAAMGCTHVIIGHCEERREKAGVLAEAGIADSSAVNRLLNREMLCAQQAGLRILYCVGEDWEEMSRRQEVIGDQLSIGLEGIDPSNVIVGYEPVWSIGPNRPIPEAEDIAEVASFIKQTFDAPVIYGGGLRSENAAMIASIASLDGGLIALTRFTGDIGFYPEEYFQIIETYMAAAKGGVEI